MSDPVILTQGNSETDATSYATASISPGSNKLILAVFNTVRFDVAESIQPTLSGAGLTWEVLRTQLYDNAGTGRARATMFRAMRGSPSTGALTFSLGGQQHLRASWIILEIDNADQTGDNGVGAIVQSNSARFDDGGGETSVPSVTLGAFAKKENMTIGYWGWGFPTVTVTPGDGFEEKGETSPANGTGSQMQWKGVEDESVDWSLSGSVEGAAFAVEIKRVGDIDTTVLTSGQDEANTTTYNTASITPDPNKILFAMVHGLRLSVLANSAPSCSGNGLTWVEVATKAFAHGAGGGGEEFRSRFSIFRAIGTAPTTGSVTFVFPETNARATFAVIQLDNADQGGVDGEDAVVQAVISDPTGGTGGPDPVATMAAFTDIANATFGGSAWSVGDPTVAPGDGFVELTENRLAPNGTGLETQFRPNNDLTVTAVYGSFVADQFQIAFGVEVKNAEPHEKIRFKKLLSVRDTSDLTVYTTESISPVADRLILALVTTADFGFTAPILVNSITGAGLTWVKVDEVQFDTIAGPRVSLAVFRALGPSPSSGALTITMDGQASEASWIITEFIGADTGGTNGSGAIVQVANDRSDSAETISAILAAFDDVLNATVGCFSVDGNKNFTLGSGFNEIAELVGDLSSLMEFRGDNETTVDASVSAGASDIAVIGIEIKNEVPFVPPPPPPPSGGIQSVPVPPGPAYIVTNLITPNPTLVTSSSVDPFYGTDFLSDGNVAKPMRWTEGLGTIFVEFDFGQQISADTIVLLNHNFPVGSTFVLKTGPLAAPTKITAFPQYRKFDIYAKFDDPLDRVWRLEITLGSNSPQPQLGEVFIANRIEMETHMNFGFSRGIEHRKNAQQTQRGTRWVFDAYSRQFFEAIFRSLKQEHVDELNKLDRLTGGERRPFVFIPDVNLADVYFVRKIGDHRAESRR